MKVKQIGVGTDIESISRFNDLRPARNIELLDRIYTREEQNYCFSRHNPPQHLAARFVGKEAVLKALSNIGVCETDYTRICITNDKNGTPRVAIQGEKMNVKVSLSLSHCEDKAVAFALAMELYDEQD
jgi:holo-[acyl-carrier protein] synthase